MKILHIISLLVVLYACCAGARSGEEQVLVRAGERDAFSGPAEWFTGSARVQPMFTSTEAIPASAGMVTFEPEARSNWHYHPTGQQIIVLSGVGRTGVRNGRVEEFRAGDVVTCPPNVHHWHGAAPNVAMTHLTITGEVNGTNTVWLKAVSDEQYGR